MRTGKEKVLPGQALRAALPTLSAHLFAGSERAVSAELRGAVSSVTPPNQPHLLGGTASGGVSADLLAEAFAKVLQSSLINTAGRRLAPRAATPRLAS